MRDTYSLAIVRATFLCLWALAACARGGSELHDWHALQPEMELSWEDGTGPEGQDAFALLYTVATGQDYAIERAMPVRGLQGQSGLRIWAKATRVVYLAVVLVDDHGLEHECTRTLLAGRWRELRFDDFRPRIQDWDQVVTVRLVDRLGSLGGQGPVSLKLAGELFDSS